MTIYLSVCIRCLVCCVIAWMTLVPVYGQHEFFKEAYWIRRIMFQGESEPACTEFTKAFSLEQASKSAYVYITALGLYELFVNGSRVGTDYFTPGFTNYQKRLQYQEYDISGLLRKGENEIKVLLAPGWYSGKFRNRFSDTARNNFGTGTALLLLLNINNGKLQVVTDSSWQWRESAARQASLYDGSRIDYNWKPGAWQPVKILQHPKDILVPTDAELVQKQESYRPVRIVTTPKGEQVADFGQNMAGWVQIKLKGKRGDTIRVAHAELLDRDSNFYTGNLRNARAEDCYILADTHCIVLEPKFTYHGFRYARFSGFKATPHNIQAVAVYSALKKTGTFECSDSMLNRLQSNIEWSLNSNFVDIPTDCPQRSERLGWTGDAQVFAGTASFLRDTRKFYSKWLLDLASEQGTNGAVANFIPTSSPNHTVDYGVAGWGDAAVIIPWTLFEWYADTAILRQQYASMKSWVNYMDSVSPGYLFKNRGYGDWYAMGDSTSLHFINQCYFAHSTKLLLQTANVLEQREDAEKYKALLTNVKDAFLEVYGKFDTKATQTQTAYALALAFDLVPGNDRKNIAGRLADTVRANYYKLSTGFLGTPYLLKALSENGHTELAYRLLLQKECPSWLYPITKGATTIWERWDAIRPDDTIQETSFNHYAYGAVGQWMYENIVGIKPGSPSYKKIIIKPLVGGNLTWAKGSYRSKYGLISSSWKIKNGFLYLDVKIPGGTTAEIYVPVNDSSFIKKDVNAGAYHYKVKWIG